MPEPLARVVEQAMDRDPARRFAAADELARALRATVPAGEIRVPGPAAHGAGARPTADAGAGLTTTFGPRPPRPEADAPGRRRRVPVVLVVVGLVAAGGIALLRGPVRVRRRRGRLRRGGPRRAGRERQVVRGDVDGDGCSVTGVYQPQALPTAPRRWS